MVGSYQPRPAMTPSPRRAWVLVALALATAVGCSMRSAPLGETPLAYRQAEDSFRRGDYEGAARGYRLFVDSEFSNDYPDLVPRAYYRLALSEYRRSRYSECLAVLDVMRDRLPDREWPQAYALRGDAEQARGNTMRALRWWEQAWEVSSGEERLAAQQHIAAALGRMDERSLTAARTVLRAPALRELVDERLAGSRPAPVGASAVARGSQRRPAGPRQAATGSRGRGGDTDARIENGRVGVLLPLSGEFATYGQRSLNGIKLAFGPLADRLEIHDTRGDIAAARAALDELIADPTIIAVLGPLRSKVAEAIAPRAESAGLPLVLLSQQGGATGQWVTQLAMTSARQAAELAQYAVGRSGVRRFGVFYPNDQYGVSLSTAFREEVERRGGTVVGSIVYDPKQREFSVERLSLDKWVNDDGLEAVFIPDYAENAIPLATLLRKGHPTVRLLGGNGWNDPGALGTAASELDGAVFVDGFFASSRRRATEEFVAAYRAAYGGTTPDILEAQAYDAALLVAQALPNAHGRSDLAQALRAPRTVQSASGTLVISPQGIQRQLFLLRLSNGTISEVVPDRMVGVGRADSETLAESPAAP
jgi:ABC-type branched-subunit amino acid transport system substrate-binding protein